MQKYRFHWRHLDKKRWYKVEVEARGDEYAHLGMRSHITHKLNKPFKEIVVDHLFFRLDENGEVAERISLNQHPHDMQVLFANKVFAPGMKP